MKKIFNLKKAVCLLVALVVMLSCLTVNVFAKTASDAKHSIVAIESADGTSYGTGFAIGKKGDPVEYIVTNNHVVNGEVNTTATVYFNLAANKMMLANVCYYNAVKDIAILRLPEPTEERVPLVLCPKEKLDPDDDYFALGYPATTMEIAEWNQFSPNDITVTRGGIKKNDTFEGIDVFYIDLILANGNSGGPLVNSKGEAAGINRAKVNNENQAIVINELIKILKNEGYPFAQAGDINFALLFGIILVLVIIALIILLVVRKNSNNAADNPSFDAGPVVIDSNPNPTTPHTAPVAPVPPAPQAQQPRQPGARVIAVGGTLNGKRYALNGAVKIGRDSSRCGIAFPVSTQGVSAVHCEVSFNGSVCYVKDLNSSYGTYTMDGRKLAPNNAQLLNSGDKFYLASPENTFEVRF